jgi:hypothetical protein
LIAIIGYLQCLFKDGTFVTGFLASWQIDENYHMKLSLSIGLETFQIFPRDTVILQSYVHQDCYYINTFVSDKLRS